MSRLQTLARGPAGVAVLALVLAALVVPRFLGGGSGDVADEPVALVELPDPGDPATSLPGPDTTAPAPSTTAPPDTVVTTTSIPPLPPPPERRNPFVLPAGAAPAAP